MTDLHHQLVICSAESCLGSPARWLPSDLAAIRLYQMMGGRLILACMTASDRKQSCMPHA